MILQKARRWEPGTDEGNRTNNDDDDDDVKRQPEKEGNVRERGRGKKRVHEKERGTVHARKFRKMRVEKKKVARMLFLFLVNRN